MMIRMMMVAQRPFSAAISHDDYDYHDDDDHNDDDHNDDHNDDHDDVHDNDHHDYDSCSQALHRRHLSCPKPTGSLD